MHWEHIRRNSPEDVRAWLAGRTQITREQFGMTAMLFDDFEEGARIVESLVEEFGVALVGEMFR